MAPRRASAKRVRKPQRNRKIGFERLEERALLAYGALPQDTMGYMLGDVVVTTVFVESEGANSTEDWTPSLIAETKAKIEEGLQWWVDSLHAINDLHDLNFILDWTHADNPFETEYEPIDGPSQGYLDWGYEWLDSVGFKSPGAFNSDHFSSDIRDFNHSQRLAENADWAFTILVANSENDLDDQWDGAGSHFTRAFAFSGGRFVVMPSGRPASTVAHEVGHQGWALDEYEESGNFYTDARGYLRVQNTNSQDNPNHVHEDSIMSNEASLLAAWANNTSSQSSLEMVGWRDSDSNGVFDILDVPHLLEGSGRARNGFYEFKGNAKVQTLFNLNDSDPNTNPFRDLDWVTDMTINTIDAVQYRIDGGAWVDIPVLGQYELDLDIKIPLPDANFHSVGIRTVTLAADRANPGQIVAIAASPEFVGGTATHDAVSPQGISGFVYLDIDENNALDALDRGLGDWVIELQDAAGQLLELTTTVEPDAFNDNTIITTATPGMTLTAQGSGVSSPNVKALISGGATSTGSGVFGFDVSSITSSAWSAGMYEMRIDFDSPVKQVAIDAVAHANKAYGRLEIFDSSDKLLGRYTTSELDPNVVETMSLASDEGDIAYAVATGHASTFIRLDKLVIGAGSTTQSNAQGFYAFPALPAGDYYVKAIAPSAVFEDISADTVMVALADQEVASHIDFGKRNTAAWHNAARPMDVDDNNVVNLIDAFAVIDGIRTRGIGALPAPTNGDEPPPYYDVNANNSLDLLDAFATIDAVRPANFTGGSGEAAFNQGPGNSAGQQDRSGSVAGEGESADALFPVSLDVAFETAETNRVWLASAWSISVNDELPLEKLEASSLKGLAAGTDPEQQASRDAPRPTARQNLQDRRFQSSRSAGRKPSTPWSAAVWEVRDLKQMELEAVLEEISEDVSQTRLVEEKAKESTILELSLK